MDGPVSFILTCIFTTSFFSAISPNNSFIKIVIISPAIIKIGESAQLVNARTGFVPGAPGKTFRAGPDASGFPRCHTEFVESAASILIVDDHDGFRTFARGMLEADGFTVAEAATGAEAAETARSVRPGLVLLDIQLPDFDGFEVARRLAAQAGGCAQAGGPVIVLTSTRDASDYGGRIGSSPAAGFLPKDQLSGAALRRFLAASSPAGA